MMSKCQHRHSTLTRAFTDEGDPFAIHQCDFCGIALPAIEPDEADIWTLPEFDGAAAERGYTRLLSLVFEYIGGKFESAINFAKGVKYREQRNLR
jgi:hypothetical protein